MVLLNEQVLTVADGSKIGISEYGDNQGKPVLYFHGARSCSAEAALLDEAASARRLLLIAPDRPGTGQSDPQPQRTILDHVHDAEQVLDQLGVDRVTVAGSSAGSMYAAGFAAVLPHRAKRFVGIVPCVPMTDREAKKATILSLRVMSVLACTMPWLVERLYAALSKGWNDKESLEKTMRHMKKSADYDILLDKTVTSKLISASRGGARMGPASAVRDVALTMMPWGFDPFAIQIPVSIIVGAGDELRPAGELLARRLGVAPFVTAGGHLGPLSPAGAQQVAAELDRS